MNERESLINFNYKTDFITNGEGRNVLSAIEDGLRKCNEFLISVAFITAEGLLTLKPILKELEDKGIRGRILTTDYLGFNSPQIVLYTLIAVAGAATIGSQILLYTFVAQYYPSTVRSTGMGWASGIGRIGAIVGPVLTGALLTFELPHQMNFLVIAIPGVIAALAVFMVNLKVSVDGEKTKSKQVFDAVKSTAN